GGAVAGGGGAGGGPAGRRHRLPVRRGRCAGERGVGGVRSRIAARSVPLPGLVHSMSMSSLAAALPADRRQSPTAHKVARGTTRLLHSLGFSVVSELPLASGRRADLLALGTDGEAALVQIN